MTAQRDFGSPVSTALGIHVETYHPHTQSTDEDDGPAGILDHADAVESQITAMRESLVRITQRTEAYTDALKSGASDLESLTAGGAKPTNDKIRAALRDTTANFERYGDFLAAENKAYESTLRPFEASLRSLNRLNRPATGKQREVFDASLDAQEGLATAVDQALVGISSMADAVEALPPIERQFNRSQRKVSRELRRLMINVERTGAIAKGAVAIGREFRVGM